MKKKKKFIKIFRNNNNFIFNNDKFNCINDMNDLNNEYIDKNFILNNQCINCLCEFSIFFKFMSNINKSKYSNDLFVYYRCIKILYDNYYTNNFMYLPIVIFKYLINTFEIVNILKLPFSLLKDILSYIPFYFYVDMYEMESYIIETSLLKLNIKIINEYEKSNVDTNIYIKKILDLPTDTFNLRKKKFNLKLYSLIYQ